MSGFELLEQPQEEPACEACGGALWYGRGGARGGVCGSCWADFEANAPHSPVELEEDECDD